ncbi:MAG: iron-containing alcohol dehydrogenase [Nitrososphaerales archaeon]
MSEYPISKVHTFTSVQRLIFGIGAINNIGECVKSLGGKKVLIITDRIITKIGLINNVIKPLEKAFIPYEVWDYVEPEPSFDVAENSVEKIREGDFDLVIGVGGGSSLDTAKATATFKNANGKVRDYIKKIIPKRDVPLILIPTTAGTGSEVSNVAVFGLLDEDFKYALFSPSLYPDMALIDPMMTVTMPPNVTANTGLDALSHAIEAYISLESSPITDIFAIEAIKLAGRYLREAYANGDNIEARYGMAKASLFAGLAFGNAGTTLGHAIGYAHAHIHHSPHGKCVAVTLPYVLEYNAIANMERLTYIAKLLGECVDELPLRDSAFRAAIAFKKLLDDLDMPSNLKALGVKREDIPNLAERVFKSPKHVARNPRKVTKEDMIKLFEKAYEGIL